MPAVDTLLTLLVEDSRNIAARMAAAGSTAKTKPEEPGTTPARRATPRRPGSGRIG